MSSPAVQVPAAMSVDETIRATVRALRSARQVDVPPLARHIGVSRGSFYNRLNGAAPFLAAEIAGLAHFFGVPITDFYEGIVRVGAAPVSLDTGVDTERYPTPTSGLAPVIPLVSGTITSYRPVLPGYGSSKTANTYSYGRTDVHSSGGSDNANAA